MHKAPLAVMLSLLAAPCAAQEIGSATVDEETWAEQPMGGIGISWSFGSTHIPQSRVHPLLVVELFADPESRIIDCSVIYPEDTAEDEAFYCRRPIGKETDFPAIGPDGNPAYGVGRVHVWKRGADWPVVPADLEIFVSQLPEERERIEIGVLVYIDEDGVMRNCQRAGYDPGFSLVACQQAAGHIFEARHGADGSAVPYVANLKVAFLTGDPGA